LQPGIIILFTLKVTFPASLVTACKVLACLKIIAPPGIERFKVDIPCVKVTVVGADEIDV